jgi:hypothetical protein
MNRAQRREAQHGKGPLAGRICEHGHLKKTDGRGIPDCPHWCGFEHLRPPPTTDSEQHG